VYYLELQLFTCEYLAICFPSHSVTRLSLTSGDVLLYFYSQHAAKLLSSKTVVRIL
jgi:hypothetical protein